MIKKQTMQEQKKHAEFELIQKNKIAGEKLSILESLVPVVVLMILLAYNIFFE